MFWCWRRRGEEARRRRLTTGSCLLAPADCRLLLIVVGVLAGSLVGCGVVEAGGLGVSVAAPVATGCSVGGPPGGGYFSPFGCSVGRSVGGAVGLGSGRLGRAGASDRSVGCSV